MAEDRRQFQSSEMLANAIFGSSPLTVEQRQRIEAEHKAAQVLPPAAPEPEKRKGWTPPGFRTDATASEFAFRNMAPPTEADLERMNRKSMMQVVSHARGLKGG
jgi:hypothetical protein